MAGSKGPAAAHRPRPGASTSAHPERARGAGARAAPLTSEKSAHCPERGLHRQPLRAQITRRTVSLQQLSLTLARGGDDMEL